MIILKNAIENKKYFKKWTFICFYICQLMNQEDEGLQIILHDFWYFRAKTRIEVEVVWAQISVSMKNMLKTIML